MQDILRLASIFKEAASKDVHRWAGTVVNEAFQQVMGRAPSPAERQIVMAVSDLESSYGRGWGKGKSTGGVGSHNWGAVQTTKSDVPSFSHGDSSAEGKYVTKFRAYPSDIAGAADVVNLLFKGERKQREPDPSHAQRAMGKQIDGPGRGELIQMAAQQGDTLAFSKAMWYTTYFEGVGSEFTQRIKSHADGIQNRIGTIASALGESPAWSIKSSNYLPVTSDQGIINRIVQMNPKAGSGGSGGYAQPRAPQAPGNVRPNIPQQPVLNSPQPQEQKDPFAGLENMLWFQ